MPKTLILGVGNLLLSDDGIGVVAAQQLQALYAQHEDVQVVDGGTCGLDLLQYLEGTERLIVVDAAYLGQSPGAIRRLEGESVPAFLSQKISPHEINLPELLFSAKLVGIYPAQVVIFAVQPQTIETGIQLSPPVAQALDELLRLVTAEISR